MSSSRIRLLLRCQRKLKFVHCTPINSCFRVFLHENLKFSRHLSTTRIVLNYASISKNEEDFSNSGSSRRRSEGKSKIYIFPQHQSEDIVRRLLHHKGKMIQELSRDLGVRLHLNSREDVAGGEPHCVVITANTQEELKDALKSFHERVVQIQERLNTKTETFHQEVIHLDEDFELGKLIGKGGQNFNKLMNMTGCSLRVHDKELGVVVEADSEENLKKAVEKVTKEINMIKRDTLTESVQFQDTENLYVMIRTFVGKEGKNLKRIIEETGALIDICGRGTKRPDSGPPRVVVAADSTETLKEAIEKVKEEMKLVVEKYGENEDFTEEIMIGDTPYINEIIGRFIGHKGKNVNLISEDTGARFIVLGRGSRNDDGGPPRVKVWADSEECLKTAVEKVKKIFESDQYSPPELGKYGETEDLTEEIMIGDSPYIQDIIGRFIGQGGKNINLLSEETGARFIVLGRGSRNDDGGPPRVKVWADSEECLKTGVEKVKKTFESDQYSPPEVGKYGEIEDLTEEILIDDSPYIRDIIGRFIGQGGKNIGFLSEETGARFTVLGRGSRKDDRGPPRVIVKAASEECLKTGVEKVKKIFNYNDHYPLELGKYGEIEDLTEEILIDDSPYMHDIIGRFIGQGGKNVNLLSEETGARIMVLGRGSRRDDGGPPRVVVQADSEECLKTAVEKVKKIFDYNGRFPPELGKYGEIEGLTREIMIGDSPFIQDIIGRFIGPGGKNINLLSEETGARFEILGRGCKNDDGGPTRVTVRADSEECLKTAVEKVKKIFESDHYSPPEFTMDITKEILQDPDNRLRMGAIIGNKGENISKMRAAIDSEIQLRVLKYGQGRQRLVISTNTSMEKLNEAIEVVKSMAKEICMEQKSKLTDEMKVTIPQDEHAPSIIKQMIALKDTIITVLGEDEADISFIEGENTEPSYFLIKSSTRDKVEELYHEIEGLMEQIRESNRQKKETQ